MEHVKLETQPTLLFGQHGLAHLGVLTPLLQSFPSPNSSRLPMRRHLISPLALVLVIAYAGAAKADATGSAFFEKKVRPILVQHCYECHSEDAGEQQGGLLLDRKSGWLSGGDTDKAVIPGEPDSSLLLKAVKYENEDLQMPPEQRLSEAEIAVLTSWIARGAPGPVDDMGETDFSRLGDQDYLFDKAAEHWAFQPLSVTDPPTASLQRWDQHAIDRFVFDHLQKQNMTPSARADAKTIIRRLHYSLTGLPPTTEQVNKFVAQAETNWEAAIEATCDRLLGQPAFGHHIARMWLDVARYADTDSAYRPDTRTPHYFPFAFTYRDYVIDAFNADKPFDTFVREQFAADLLGFQAGDPEIAALGFFGVGPHFNRAQAEALDDWIDVTTRGLMGLTVACARCHDHKYEPVPTADYYSLRGVFASVKRLSPLDDKNQPVVNGYEPSAEDLEDYQQKHAAITKKITDSGNKKARGNNRSIATKIRETELAQLMLFHPGGPAHAMIVRENPRRTPAYIFVRGDAAARGAEVPRRFVKVLDPEQTPFGNDNSGRLELAQKITDPSNPLTARVYVNRIWGFLTGAHLVATPSDFGLQGSRPTHPELLDWLTADFIHHGWSTKHLVRRIVLSETFLQRSRHREEMAKLDPRNDLLWRANRQHLSIEMLRDSLLAVSDQLDLTPRGRSQQLWGEDYTLRRAVYGYINRFNLDPTLRAFDFPTPMQTQGARGESIVASQSLFTMNSPFVIDRAAAIIDLPGFKACGSNSERTEWLFGKIYQRSPHPNELLKVERFVLQQERLKPSPRFKQAPWPLVAQSLMMANEFQYVD